MTTALLAKIREAGLILIVEEPNTIIVRGPREVRDRWLPSIRENKPALLELLRQQPAANARAYYLRQVGEAAVPAFYERVLGNTPKSIATLEPVHRKEAARLGLLPREIVEGDMVVLAYRHNGAQGLLTVPADRYDGFEVLRIFDVEEKTC